MRSRLVAGIALIALAWAGASAAAAGRGTHAARSHAPIAVVGANRSSNWSGYNQGTLEKGGEQFHSIAGGWVVPKATQHRAGEAEYSATWLGIGGGCIDAGCTLTDATLIQAGTSQDVAASGRARYYAWWEVIPAPSVTISTVPIHPGDHVHVRIGEVVAGSELWRIVLHNVTTGKTFTTTVPYASTHATAEWIEETPVVVGSGGAGVAAMPDLGTVRFSAARVDGVPAHLVRSEKVRLVSGDTVVATPSDPGPRRRSFNDCTYRSSCPAPGG